MRCFDVVYNVYRIGRTTWSDRGKASVVAPDGQGAVALLAIARNWPPDYQGCAHASEKSELREPSHRPQPRSARTGPRTSVFKALRRRLKLFA